MFKISRNNWISWSNYIYSSKRYNISNILRTFR
nr:MAG TPA: hypothetical protein [Caudoviricetes sp.]